jgi:hypothetical protein
MGRGVAQLARSANPVFLVFHKDLRQVPRVRLVVSALELAIRRALRWACLLRAGWRGVRASVRGREVCR